MNGIVACRPRLAIVGLALALAASRAVAAEPPPAPPAASPDVDATSSARLVYGLVTDHRYGYFGRDADDAVLDAVLARFLDALDPDRLLFTEADATAFRRDDKALKAAASRGEFGLAHAIFDKCRELETARAAFVRKRLAEPGGLREDGDWLLDRRAAPRPRDAAERERLWRQSLANDALEFALAGLDDARIRDALDARERTRVQRLESARPLVEATFISAVVQAIDPAGDYVPPVPSSGGMPEGDPAPVGVGLAFEQRGAFVAIRSVLPGGPAAESGAISVGDRVLAVGEGDTGPMASVLGLDTEGAVRRVRGAPGTTIRLQLLPAKADTGGPGRLVTLRRRGVELPDDSVQASVVEVAGRRIGVLDLDAFYDDFDPRRRETPDAVTASRHIAQALERFGTQRIDAVLLDLRGNGGGSLREAVKVAGLFLGGGPVLQAREARGRSTAESADAAAPAWSGPLGVLVDERSAAAAEIVAAALHDRGRGLVLGRRTFGRGSVQNLVDLDRWSVAPVRRYGGVKLTVGMVYRVNGLPIEGDGLEPDIALGPPAAPLPRDTAVPAVAPVPALPTRESQWADALATSLPRLRDAHATRLAATPAFRDWARARQAAEDGRRSGRLSLDPAIRRSQRLPGTSGDDVERQLALAVMADMAEAAAKSRSGAPNAR